MMDSKMNKNDKICELKEALNEKNENKCVESLLFLVCIYNTEITCKDEYNHDLKHQLFTLDVVKNPLGVKYDKKLNDLTLHTLYKVIDIISKTNIDKRIIMDLKELYIYSKQFWVLNNDNQTSLDNNSFAKKTYVEQVLAICLYFQDQLRDLNEKYDTYIDKRGVTGLELSIASGNKLNGIQGTPLDILELELESINQIVRYLYYKHGKTLLDKIAVSDQDIVNAWPHEDKAFTEYMNINCQYALLKTFEEGIRYGYFSLAGRDFKNDKPLFYFDFEDEKKSMARYFALFRREYLFKTSVMYDARNSYIYNQSRNVLPELAKELNDKQIPGKVILELTAFHPDKRKLDIVSTEAAAKINVVNSLTKQFYFECTIKGIKVSDYLVVCKYLCSLAEIIYVASKEHINENDKSSNWKELAVVDLSYLTSELCRLYKYKDEYAELLIDCFVFHEKNNKGEDIFANPLIKISKSQVVICHAFINQLNVDRALERLFSRYETNISGIGKEFEKEFVSSLTKGYHSNLSDRSYKVIPNFHVNESTVQYTAYDGKEIEFDVIATLDDYLILTELKSIMTPYDYSGLESKKTHIYDAVKQLLRRRESIHNDWIKFKSMVSIEMPDEPFDNDHILMIACTDAYDYTPLKIGEVYVTDDSSYIKYFTAPYSDAFTTKCNGKIIKKHKSLWKSDRPHVKEFIEFLENPITIYPYKRCLKKEFTHIPVKNDADAVILLADYKLNKDPILEELYPKKTYPNDLCPCGSRIKYKFCCMKKK